MSDSTWGTCGEPQHKPAKAANRQPGGTTHLRCEGAMRATHRCHLWLPGCISASVTLRGIAFTQSSLRTVKTEQQQGSGRTFPTQRRSRPHALLCLDVSERASERASERSLGATPASEDPRRLSPCRDSGPPSQRSRLHKGLNQNDTALHLSLQHHNITG